jgi:Arginase/agmatinase/formimionoglutamate hydrolase, arginase family
MIQKATIDQANTAKFGIIGYACDIGVKRNKGRIGAQQGPKAIRQQLGKLPVHFSNTTITDFGTITAIDNSLEDCQTGLSYAITKLIKNNTIPIALGGGHDMAYANFNGIKKA